MSDKITNPLYVFLCLHIQCGEYEFYSDSVHYLDGDEVSDIEAWADEYASVFYGSKGEGEKENDTYYFNAGEVAVEVNNVRSITSVEFDTLYKFL